MTNQTDPMRILLVEDSRHDFIALRRTLRKNLPEAELVHFERSEDALKRLSLDAGAFDVIVADHNLPGMTGLDFCRSVISASYTVPTVLLTGQGTEGLALTALKAGVYDYVIKDPQQGYLDLIPLVISEVVRRHDDRLARKQAEKALRKSRQLLDETQHIARLGGWEYNPETGEYSWTDVVYEIYEVEKDFVPTPERERTFYLPAYRQTMEETFSDAVQTGKSWNVILEMVTAKGHQRWVRSIGKVSRKAGHTVKLFGTLQDITERKKMEAELLRAKKIEATGTLAAGIAHDFNNLLFIILGNLMMGKESLDPGHPALAFLQKAETASLKARDLTRKFVRFSSGAEPVRKRFHPLPFLEDILKMSLGGSNIRHTLSAPENLRHMEIDRNQMHQVIYNIIENAKQAMPEGGTLSVSIENMPLSADRNNEPALQEGGEYIRISFRDQGRGIAESDLPNVFDPYFSTQDRGSQKGMGLGLTIAYSTVKSHDGHMEIHSAPGEGTEVVLYLPALPSLPPEPQPPGRETRPVSSKPLSSRKTKRILVMDDEEMVRGLARTMLNRLGYDQVGLAPHGDDAIHQYVQAREKGNPFDLVILDLTVKGGKGGQETIRILRDMAPEIRAVVASGYLSETEEGLPEQAGFDAALSKPYTLKQLRDILEKLMGEE